MLHVQAGLLRELWDKCRCCNSINPLLEQLVNMEHYWSSGSVVGLATRLQAGWPGIRIPVGLRDSSLLQNFQAGPGAHLASYSVGTGVISRGRRGHGVNHSSPSSEELKNVWSYTPNPL